MTTVKVESRHNLQNLITSGTNTLTADEPLSAGGDNTGFDPYSLLLAALGACTSMTLKLYARNKKWDLQNVEVILTHEKVHAEDCENCESKPAMLDRIERKIFLEGDLTDDQRKRLFEIAKRCPVHRTLTSKIEIVDEQFF
jgi:putative redox protein